MTTTPAEVEQYRDQIRRFRECHERILTQVRRVIVGQDEIVEQLLFTLWAGGHCLITGMPGTAKTLLVRTLASALSLGFKRIQFTPDLMPSDITGTEILEEDVATGRRRFVFVRGPVFTSVLLADEINRTPPKTQAALLEAMQERTVSVAGKIHHLGEPFLVLATQNPIEQEGTYPLPEAQLDRFLFKLEVGYPSLDDELTVLTRHDQGLDPHDVFGAGVRPVAGPAELAAAQAGVAELRVERPVLQYVVSLVRATRDSPSLALGVSPRGATALLHAAKAWAWLSGRGYVTPDEVRAMAKPALRHRLLVRPELELEGVTADGVLDGVLATVPVPR